MLGLQPRPVAVEASASSLYAIPMLLYVLLARALRLRRRRAAATRSSAQADGVTRASASSLSRSALARPRCGGCGDGQTTAGGTGGADPGRRQAHRRRLRPRRR